MEGIEESMKGLQKLFLGENLGKVIIRVDTSLPYPKL